MSTTPVIIDPSAFSLAETAEFTSLESQIAALEARVSALESAPKPSESDEPRFQRLIATLAKYGVPFQG